MKRIGLVGGISWVSTIDYYRHINEEVNRRLGDINYADCIIYSLNFGDFQKTYTSRNWEQAYRYLLDASENLEKAGAELILLCANTAHAVADRLKENIRLPIVHIAQETAMAIKKSGLKKVGLIGTKFTMEMSFYRDKLSEAGIDTIIPENEEWRNYIQHTLKVELGKGIFRKETKERYLEIVNDLIGQGAEGIVLGCTEIPMMIEQADLSVPVFDTTRIHALAAVDLAMSN
jgi:aspartate racemase